MTKAAAILGLGTASALTAGCGRLDRHARRQRSAPRARRDRLGRPVRDRHDGHPGPVARLRRHPVRRAVPATARPPPSANARSSTSRLRVRRTLPPRASGCARPESSPDGSTDRRAHARLFPGLGGHRPRTACRTGRSRERPWTHRLASRTTPSRHGVTGFAFDIDSEPASGAGLLVTTVGPGESSAESAPIYWGGAHLDASPVHAGHNEFRWSEVGPGSVRRDSNAPLRLLSSQGTTPERRELRLLHRQPHRAPPRHERALHSRRPAHRSR